MGRGRLLSGPQVSHRLSQRMDVLGRSAAAAADDARTESDGIAAKLREIFGRGTRINDTIAHALRESRVGHGGKRPPGAGQFLENGKNRLGTERAVGADGLHVFVREVRRDFPRAEAAERDAVFGKGHLRDDRQCGKRPDRVHGGQQDVEVGEGLEQEEIDAALFERQGLLAVHFADLIGGKIANLRGEGYRAHRTAISTSRAAASRASRATFTPR